MKPSQFCPAIVLGTALLGGCHHSAAKADLTPAPTLAMVVKGDSLFHTRGCFKCHGNDAKGRKNGPNLTAGPFLHVNGSYADFIRLITSGVPEDSIKVKTHEFDMQPRGGNRNPMTDQEIREVAAYVYSLSHPIR